MNFDNQPTIQIPQIGGEAPIIRTPSTTPAIAALMDATRQGAVDFDTIFNHLEKGSKTVRSMAEDRTAVAKGIQDRKVLPQEFDIRKRELEQKDFEVRLAARAQQGRVDEQDFKDKSAKVLRAQDQKIMGDDESGAYKAQADFYRSNIGPLPAYSDGSINYSEMTSTVNDFTEAKKRLIADGLNTPANLAIIKEAVDNGVPVTGRSVKEIEADLVRRKSTPLLKQEDIDKTVTAIMSGDKTRDAIKQARLYVNDKNTTPVGPGFTEGSRINQWYQAVATTLGADSTKYEQQNELEMKIAGGVLSSIKDLAGSGAGRIMASEVALMERNMPHLSSTKASWNRWLDSSEKLLEQLRSKNAEKLSAGGIATPKYASAGPGGRIPEAPENAQRISTDEGRVFVRTQAELMALQSGVAYVTSRGQRGTRSK